MFTELFAKIATKRGRFPVANMAGDFMAANHQRQFTLGEFMASLETSTVEDIQTKLDMLLQAQGPDHAAEDLILCVELLNAAQPGVPPQMTSEQIHHRLFCWFEANVLEKLRRAGLLTLQSPLSIDPANVPQVTFAPGFVESLAKREAAGPARLSAP